MMKMMRVYWAVEWKLAWGTIDESGRIAADVVAFDCPIERTSFISEMVTSARLNEAGWREAWPARSIRVDDNGKPYGVLPSRKQGRRDQAKYQVDTSLALARVAVGVLRGSDAAEALALLKLLEDPQTPSTVLLDSVNSRFFPTLAGEVLTLRALTGDKTAEVIWPLIIF